MDRFDEWTTFQSVVETGSFSRAAERLGIAKSAVSRRISDLEQRLGAALINRSTRQFSLTETGRAFYERTQRILADVSETEESVRDDHRALKGSLRIAAPLTFGVMHLAPALETFLRQHPDVTVDLDLNDRYVNLIEDGYDLALRIAGGMEDSTLIARRLAPIRRLACASPAYLSRYGRPRSPEDLARYRALKYTNVPEKRAFAYVGADGKERSVRVPASFAASNGSVITQMAIAGFGIAMQPTFIVAEPIERGELEIVLPETVWTESQLYVVYPPGRAISCRVRAFIDFLADRFSAPAWDEQLEAAASAAE